jgi:hypothetical protein
MRVDFREKLIFAKRSQFLQGGIAAIGFDLFGRGNGFSPVFSEI